MVVWQYLQTPIAQAVIWVSVGAVFAVVAFYIVRKFRDAANLENATADHLTNFREMKQRGVLKDAEFRNIKTTLSGKLAEEKNDVDQ